MGRLLVDWKLEPSITAGYHRQKSHHRPDTSRWTWTARGFMGAASQAPVQSLEPTAHPSISATLDHCKLNEYNKLVNMKFTPHIQFKIWLDRNNSGGEVSALRLQSGVGVLFSSPLLPDFKHNIFLCASCTHICLIYFWMIFKPKSFQWLVNREEDQHQCCRWVFSTAAQHSSLTSDIHRAWLLQATLPTHGTQ